MRAHAGIVRRSRTLPVGANPEWRVGPHREICRPVPAPAAGGLTGGTQPLIGRAADPVYTRETFEADEKHSRLLDAPPAEACEAAPRPAQPGLCGDTRRDPPGAGRQALPARG